MNRNITACDFAIFGVLGDLSRRKLLPSLYQLDKVGLLHEQTRIIGVARHEISRDEFVEKNAIQPGNFCQGPPGP